MNRITYIHAYPISGKYDNEMTECVECRGRTVRATNYFKPHHSVSTFQQSITLMIGRLSIKLSVNKSLPEHIANIAMSFTGPSTFCYVAVPSTVSVLDIVFISVFWIVTPLISKILFNGCYRWRYCCLTTMLTSCILLLLLLKEYF